MFSDLLIICFISKQAQIVTVSSWFNSVFAYMITNVLRIRHCLLFMSRIPIMNYDTAWFVGLLGWIAFIEFIFNQAEISHSGDFGAFILMWIQVQLPCFYVPK